MSNRLKNFSITVLTRGDPRFYVRIREKPLSATDESIDMEVGVCYFGVGSLAWLTDGLLHYIVSSLWQEFKHREYSLELVTRPNLPERCTSSTYIWMGTKQMQEDQRWESTQSLTVQIRGTWGVEDSKRREKITTVDANPIRPALEDK